jgi:hypothetical protein
VIVSSKDNGGKCVPPLLLRGVTIPAIEASPKAWRLVAGALMVFAPHLLYAESQPREVATEYSVELHYGTLLPLSHEVALSLYSKTVSLLQSSQGSSRWLSWTVPCEEVQQEYLDALKSKYLLVTFPAATTIQTNSGPITASQIIVRLGPHDQNWRSRYPDHFMDSLLAIDQYGDLVGYGSYSGEALFDVLHSVACVVPNSKFVCSLEHFAMPYPTPSYVER